MAKSPSRKQKLDVVPRSSRGFFSGLGPGLITGAADDDPSGISTYSVTGAAFGYAPLWTALFSFPLMTAVQMMCARLGMVTGEGLAGVIRAQYSKWILWGACSLLVVANTVNIGADLGGMGKVTEMVTGINAMFWTLLYGAVIGSLLIWSTYDTIARIFKWLTLVLFAYIVAAVLAKPDWGAVVRATLIPHVEMSSEYWATLVGSSEPPFRPISVLLAGVAGSGGGAQRGAGELVKQRQGNHGRGVETVPQRRRDGNVLLEPDHVLHHLDHRRHAPCAWKNEHHNCAGCRGGPTPAGRQRGVLAF